MIAILDWVWPETRRKLVVFLIGPIFFGVAQTMLFWIAMTALSKPFGDESVFRLFLMFLVLAIILHIGRDYFGRWTFASIDDVIEQYRARSCSALLAMPLTQFENLTNPAVMQSLFDGPQTIVEGSVLVERICNNICVQTFMILTIAITNPGFWPLAMAYGLTVFMVVGVAVVIVLDQDRLQRKRSEGLDTAFGDLVDGFKETRLDAGLRDRLIEQAITPRLEASAIGRYRTSRIMARAYTSIDMLVIIVVMGVVILLPSFVGDDISVVSLVVMVGLVMPISLLLEVPNIARVYTTTETLGRHIVDLEAAVDDHRQWLDGGEQPVRHGMLKDRISITDLAFTYPSQNGLPSFSIGPLSLIIPAGSICFLTGGNGSGKSTILKSIIGLYRAQNGTTLIDGEVVHAGQDQGFISAIFTDSILFEEFYGYRDSDEARVNELLDYFGLGKKVHFARGRLSTTDLSTGQRKRVALALAMVENRPIWALDEWAADQDPEFRRWFYMELLPRERARGRTILAVTHDDPYFYLADQIIHCEYGKIDLTQPI